MIIVLLFQSLYYINSKCKICTKVEFRQISNFHNFYGLSTANKTRNWIRHKRKLAESFACICYNFSLIFPDPNSSRSTGSLFITWFLLFRFFFLLVFCLVFLPELAFAFGIQRLDYSILLELVAVSPQGFFCSVIDGDYLKFKAEDIASSSDWVDRLASVRAAVTVNPWTSLQETDS